MSTIPNRPQCGRFLNLLEIYHTPVLSNWPTAIHIGDFYTRLREGRPRFTPNYVLIAEIQRPLRISSAVRPFLIDTLIVGHLAHIPPKLPYRSLTHRRM